MMSHMAPAGELAKQAKLMESYGAHCVYVTDSGGRLTMDGVRERVRAYRDVLDPGTEIGIHAHENLSLSVANSVVAVEDGRHPGRRLAGRARRRRRQLPDRAVHRGRRPHAAGSTAATSSRSRTPPTTSSDRCRTGPVRVDRETLTLGYAGVYSSFLRHAEAASERYGVDVRDILLEVRASAGSSAARRT